jgi:hypothetical protein
MQVNCNGKNPTERSHDSLAAENSANEPQLLDQQQPLSRLTLCLFATTMKSTGNFAKNDWALGSAIE